MSEDAEKTEDATPEKRRKAREEGQFPRAKDTGSVAATLAVLLVLGAFGAQMGGLIVQFLTDCLRHPTALMHGDLRTVSHQLMTTLGAVTIPLAVAAALAAIAAGVIEGGFEPRLELAAPKWSRLDPASKLGQMFSPKTTATNLFLTLGRVGLVGMVTFLIVKDSFGDLLKLSRAPIEASTSELWRMNMRFAIWATATMVVMAALDYGVAWFRHEQNIKMSRQEIKDEHIQQEGDPRVKGRQRQKAREMATKGLVKRIKESDVVVTNPTHVAVALRYRPQEGAPVMNAKGYDEVAQHIKKLAKENNITIVENVSLARALAQNGRVGKAIPLEFYAAVAEVLAFVYRARDRRKRA